MTDVPFTNREIITMHKRMEDKYDSLADLTKEHYDSSKESHAKLLAHVDNGFKQLGEKQDKTNGRVRWNEKMIYLAIGALGIIAPILGWYMVDYIEFKDSYKADVADAVQQAFDGYEPELVE